VSFETLTEYLERRRWGHGHFATVQEWQTDGHTDRRTVWQVTPVAVLCRSMGCNCASDFGFASPVWRATK